MKIAELVTKEAKSVERVKDLLVRLTATIENNECVALAYVVVKKDGGSIVQAYGDGNRLMLLGAVTDLQHDLGKAGYEHG